ncbi:MAG: insulinase family protein [Flavobacteriales bacterium]|nr:insulinase family protein [Flavobacteriales bacterium]MCB9449644.1 insulinase family protein [Flavobacteriales bacterium]
MKFQTILLVALIAIASCASAQIDRSKAPAPAPAKEINLGNYEQFTLDNGLKVFVVENHKLPRVSFRLTVDYTPVMEGDDAGYVTMAGDLLKRGTENRTKEQIDEQIDLIGANLNTSSGGMSASCLKQHADDLLKIMSDILLHPSFPEAELEKLRTQQLSALATTKDDPNSMAENVGNVLRFSAQHPYGEVVTEASVKKINAAQCRSFYDAYFKPNISYLAIVGDVNLKEARTWAESYFGAWKKGEVKVAHYPTPKGPEKIRVCLVDKPGAVQSVVMVTYPVELTPGHPDAIKASVMNAILGGDGFSGRLMQNLREDKAYTYGSYSSLHADKLIGDFKAYAQVRNEVTDSAVTEILYEIKRLRDEDVPEDLLKMTINKLSGSFARSLEYPQTVAGFAISKAIYGLPDDYYSSYLQKLEKITPKDIREMAQKYLHPDQAYILVVGSKDAVKDKLTTFSSGGKVEMYDHYGVELKDAKPLPEGLTAQKVIDDFLMAISGQADAKKAVKALDKVQDVTIKMGVSLQGQSFEINTYSKKPGKYAMTLGNENMTIQEQRYDGQRGISKSIQGTKEITGKELEDLKYSSLLMPELQYQKLGFKVELKGSEQIDGKDCYLLEVTDPAGGTEWQYFDAGSHLRKQIVTNRETPMGNITQTTRFDGYQVVDGVKFPFKISQNMGPQSLEMTVTTVKLNSNLPDSTFKVD